MVWRGVALWGVPVAWRGVAWRGAAGRRAASEHRVEAMTSGVAVRGGRGGAQRDKEASAPVHYTDRPANPSEQ